MREMLRLVNLINMNRMHNKRYFETKIFKTAKPLLKMLIKLRIVDFIKQKNDNFLFFINLEGRLKLIPVIKKNRKYITRLNIIRICESRKWMAILSTHHGLLTVKDCIKRGTGGFVLFKILLNV